MLGRNVWMECGSVCGPQTFSEAMQHIRRSSWYWGSMSWRDAEKVLISRPPGTYLVRDSASDRYVFTISYRTGNSVHHTRLAQHGGNFCLGGPNSLVKANSLVSFIENSMRRCGERKICVLMHPKSDRSGIEILQLNHLLHRHELLPPLKYLCRVVIRNSVERKKLTFLPLPPNMIRYLGDPKYLIPPCS